MASSDAFPRRAGPPLSWRDRLLPRSVLGMTMLLLMASLGAAFSGTVLYAYYEYRLNKNEQRVTTFINRFDKQFQGALNAIKTEREDAKNQIKRQLEPLQKVAAEGTTLDSLSQEGVTVGLVRAHPRRGRPAVGGLGVRRGVGQQPDAAPDVVHDRARRFAPARAPGLGQPRR